MDIKWILTLFWCLVYCLCLKPACNCNLIWQHLLNYIRYIILAMLKHLYIFFTLLQLLFLHYWYVWILTTIGKQLHINVLTFNHYVQGQREVKGIVPGLLHFLSLRHWLFIAYINITASLPWKPEIINRPY